MADKQHHTLRGERWWVTGLLASKGTRQVTTDRPEVDNPLIEEIPWGHGALIVANINHNNHWPLEQAWVARNIAHWCREHCRSAWHIGELDHVYFEDDEEALDFMMHHLR